MMSKKIKKYLIILHKTTVFANNNSIKQKKEISMKSKSTKKSIFKNLLSKNSTKDSAKKSCGSKKSCTSKTKDCSNSAKNCSNKARTSKTKDCN